MSFEGHHEIFAGIFIGGLFVVVGWAVFNYRESLIKAAIKSSAERADFLLKDRDKLAQELQVLHEKLAAASTKRLHDLQRQETIISKDTERHKQAVERLNATIHLFEGETQSLSQHLEIAKQSLEHYKSRETTLSESLETMRQKFIESETTRDDLESEHSQKISTLTGEVRRLSQDNTECHSLLTSLREQLKFLKNEQSRLAQFETESIQLRSENVAAKNTIEAMKLQLDDHQAIIQEQEQIIIDMRADHDTMSQQISHAKLECEAQANFARDLQEQLSETSPAQVDQSSCSLLDDSCMDHEELLNEEIALLYDQIDGKEQKFVELLELSRRLGAKLQKYGISFPQDTDLQRLKEIQQDNDGNISASILSELLVQTPSSSKVAVISPPPTLDDFSNDIVHNQ